MSTMDEVERVARAIYKALEPNEHQGGHIGKMDAYTDPAGMRLTVVDGALDLRGVAGAAISALSEWQGMETAPKDGTQILVRLKDATDDEVAIAAWYAPYGYDPGWAPMSEGSPAHSQDGDFDFLDPWQWHPLPK